MREITSHKVNGLNESLKIEVMDEPGAGGACHHYRVSWPQNDQNPEGVSGVGIYFQNGPVLVSGVNGLSQEALLAIVKDRLESFQAGQYACVENDLALNKINDAIEILHERTKARMARGVEGTHAK